MQGDIGRYGKTRTSCRSLESKGMCTPSGSTCMGWALGVGATVRGVHRVRVGAMLRAWATLSLSLPLTPNRTRTPSGSTCRF